MEKRYLVPEGMMKAGFDSLLPVEREQPMTAYGTFLEAALRWLAENPIVPTQEQNDAMFDSGGDVDESDGWIQYAAVEWQRRMFLAPEPEYGFIECDTCRAKSGSPTLCRGCLHNREVIEAFRRGTEAAK